MESKVCKGCSMPKSIEDFYDNGKPSRATLCKPCHVAKGRRWKAENADRANQLARRGYWKNRERIVLRSRGPAKKPVKTESRRIQRAAQAAVYYAVKTGRLMRPSACPECRRDDVPIQGHHADYSKKLEVVWLCKWCHDAEHHGTAARQDRPADARIRESRAARSRSRHPVARPRGARLPA